MNCTVVLDWKAIAVLGLVAVEVILAYKDPEAAKEALVHVSDAVKELAIASNSHC